MNYQMAAGTGILSKKCCSRKFFVVDKDILNIGTGPQSNYAVTGDLYRPVGNNNMNTQEPGRKKFIVSCWRQKPGKFYKQRQNV